MSLIVRVGLVAPVYTPPLPNGVPFTVHWYNGVLPPLTAVAVNVTGVPRHTEFADSVINRLTNDEDVYRTMLKDIYQNGQVLQRKKYRYLGFAYRAFLVGLTLTVIAVMAQFALSTGH